MSSGTHSLFSPSSGHRWGECPGSMAFPENVERGGTSVYAEEGTAAHTLSSWCLAQGKDADSFLGTEIFNESGMSFTVDEDMARHVQTYVDDVRRRSLSGHLLIEQKLQMPDVLGEDGGGTSDAVIYAVKDELLIGEDLKFGQGEVVYASYIDKQGVTRINHQLGLYLHGARRDAQMIYEPKTFTGVISQPRVGHLDEHTITVEELEDFARKMTLAREQGERVMRTMTVPLDAETNPPELEPYLNPGEKTCRWCSAKLRCSKLKGYIEQETRSDFDTIASAEPTPPTENLAMLGKAMAAVPLIEDWCRAVRAALDRHVRDGKEVIGTDGKPYKIVEGKLGNRGWSSKVEAEEALLGVLSADKVYEPQEIITAAAAKKLLDKKATKKTWQEIFEPIDETTKLPTNLGLVRRAPGRPVVVLGSDPRPPYIGSASSDDFDEIQPEAE